MIYISEAFHVVKIICTHCSSIIFILFLVSLFCVCVCEKWQRSKMKLRASKSVIADPKYSYQAYLSATHLHVSQLCAKNWNADGSEEMVFHLHHRPWRHWKAPLGVWALRSNTSGKPSPIGWKKHIETRCIIANLSFLDEFPEVFQQIQTNLHEDRPFLLWPR